MTNISNSFAYDFRQFPSKYTISTLQSVDTTDNQYGYGRILKYSRFTRELFAVLCYGYRDIRLALQSLFFAILRCKVTHFFRGCQPSVAPSELIPCFLRRSNKALSEMQRSFAAPLHVPARL